MTLLRSDIVRVCVVYSCVASAWIILTDVITHDTAQAVALSVGKGLLFVGVTASLLYGLMRRIGRSNDARFLSFLHDHPTPGLVVDPQDSGRIVDANAAAAAFYGWTLPELRKRRIGEINTASPETVAQRMREAAGHERSTFHFRHRIADGSERAVCVHSGPVRIDGRDLLYSIIIDETESQRQARLLQRQRDLYAAMVDVNASVMRSSDSQDILALLCRIAVERGGVRFAWVGRTDWTLGKVVPTARHGEDRGYVDAVLATLRPDDPMSRGPSSWAAQMQRARVLKDFLAEPDTRPWHELARQCEVRSSASFPILVDHETVAVFSLYSEVVDFFEDEIVELFQRLVDVVCFGLVSLKRAAEARAAADARHEVDQRWRMAMDAAGHGVWDWNTASNMVFYSARWKAMLGYEEHEIGDSLDEWKLRIHPDDLERTLKVIDEHVVGRTPAYTSEHRLRCKDGSYRWILTSGGVVERNTLGSPVRLVGTHTDMTRWREMQAWLDYHVAVAQALTQQSVAGVAILREGRVVMANATLAQLLGRPLPELEGMYLAALARAPQDAEAERLLGGATAGTESMQVDRPDDGSITLDVHASPVRLHDGVGVVAVFVDASDRVRLEHERADYIARIEQTVLDSVDAMSQLVELRDPYTAGHERRVGEIAALIAGEMGRDRAFQRSLRICGAVHDVGKMSVPAEILTKPGRLTPTEYALVQQHCRAGEEVLRKIASPWPLAAVALQHHERWNGSGYPQGLSGEAIVLEARIVAVADVIESMASHRPYRASQGLLAALAEIEQGSGVAYDPAVCTAALRLFRDRGLALPD